MQDIPYNTSWKDDKPIRKNETPDPLNKNNNFIEIGPWCEACKLPHMKEWCLVVRSILEEKIHVGYDQQIVNTLSSTPFREEDDSSKE